MKALPGAFINTGAQSLNAHGGQRGNWAPQLLQPSTGHGKLGRRKKAALAMNPQGKVVHSKLR